MSQAAELSDFSTDDLLAEIIRRRNREEAPKVKKWCDDCKNFKAWTKDCDPPDNYNACAHGHKMSFHVGSGYSSEPWGFYRRVCEDRIEMPACQP